MKYKNPAEYFDIFKEDSKSFNWSLKELDLSKPEYIFREDCATKLSTQSVDKILKEYVYHDRFEVQQVVDLARKHVLKDELQGVGLELGAGTGILSSTIAKSNVVDYIFSLEVVKNMTTLIIPKVSKDVLGDDYKKVIPVNGSFNVLELADNSIDFSFELGSLHHSPDLLQTLKEVYRVLKPGGRLLCFDRSHSNRTPDSEIDDMLNIRYGKEFLIANGYPEDINLTRAENGEHEIRLHEWESNFKKAGFLMQEVSYFVQPTFKNLIKGMFFLIPYTIRSKIYSSVNMANYEKNINYWFYKIVRPSQTKVVSSPIGCTVFLAIKPR